MLPEAVGRGIPGPWTLLEGAGEHIGPCTGCHQRPWRATSYRELLCGRGH